jgi:hypothetical protein
MDGLSAAASVIAVLQLAGEVVKYLSDVKAAPRECQECMIEASNLQNLLVKVRCRLEQGQNGDPWFERARTLGVEKGPLEQCKEALELLLSKVEIQDSAQKFKKRLLWKFNKAEVSSILGKMERLKSLINVELDMDHL